MARGRRSAGSGKTAMGTDPCSALADAARDANDRFGDRPVKSPTQPCPRAGKSTTDAEAIDQGIGIIKQSTFGKTEEGKKVLKKIEELKKADKISFSPQSNSMRGKWTGDKILISNKYARNPDAIASELVHEATHAVNEDEFPASKRQVTIDEECRTNKNQVDLYTEQRKSGYRDPELDRRWKADKKGKLRDDVRSRYRGTPEHLGKN